MTGRQFRTGDYDVPMHVEDYVHAYGPHRPRALRWETQSGFGDAETQVQNAQGWSDSSGRCIVEEEGGRINYFNGAGARTRLVTAVLAAANQGQGGAIAT